MLETHNGTYPIMLPLTIDKVTSTYTVIFKPDKQRCIFETIDVRLASGERVTGKARLLVAKKARDYLFVLLEAEASDEPVGRFDRNERVLVAYYYTIACYLRDDRRVVCDKASLPVLYDAARAISKKTAGLHKEAREGGHDVPKDFETRIRGELQLVRKDWRHNHQLYFDNDRWEFFVSCLGAVFAWRSGKISSRALRLAITIMPEYHRRTIREAGGL